MDFNFTLVFAIDTTLHSNDTPLDHVTLLLIRKKCSCIIWHRNNDHMQFVTLRSKIKCHNLYWCHVVYWMAFSCTLMFARVWPSASTKSQQGEKLEVIGNKHHACLYMCISSVHDDVHLHCTCTCARTWPLRTTGWKGKSGPGSILVEWCRGYMKYMCIGLK